LRMVSEAISRRYFAGQFADQDITRCTGLTPRAYRELIKLKAVRTVTERRGPGRVRLGDRTTLKRTAVIAALNQAGLSLATSGQIAFFAPYHSLLYEVCDPGAILYRRPAGPDPDRELPPRVEKPKFDWFDADKPAEADSATDWLIDICDSRFVGIRYTSHHEPTIFGDLRDDGARFVDWYPRRERTRPSGPIVAFAQEFNPRAVEACAAWQEPAKWASEFALLGYAFERHDHADDPLCMAAEAAMRSPVVVTTVNITLAIRKALRRYLGLEPALLDPQHGAQSSR